MRKTLYTLNVNGYAPEITKRTYPLLRYYAEKIGAEFFVIDSRKFPDWPVTYEKLQIKELAKERGDEWSFYIDSDALVHPETLDWTCYIPKNTVAHNGVDMGNVRWRFDEYFKRDGRSIGSCNWCTIASEWCLDLWTPLDIPLAQALEAIYPTVHELNTVITVDHLIDDYTLSRNIARYGLKLVTLGELEKTLGFQQAEFFWHAYTIPIAEKVAEMDKVLDRWKIPKRLRG